MKFQVRYFKLSLAAARLSQQFCGDLSLPPRRLPRSLSVAGFMEQLRARNIQFSSLDTHDQVKGVSKLRVITILITDQHTPLIDSLLTRSRWSRGVVCEVYSVTGLATFC